MRELNFDFPYDSMNTWDVCIGTYSAVHMFIVILGVPLHFAHIYEGLICIYLQTS
jgi:hypothetical protein